MKAIAKSLVGIDKADDELQAARKAACEACDKKRTIAGIDACGFLVFGGFIDPKTCGCSLKLKRRVRGEVCPLGKWPGETPVEYDMEV